MQPNNAPDQNPTRPQNLSCPAGGTNWHQPQPNETSNGQRGVIVAPPSGNTDDKENDKMQVLHMGFDTLTIAIQANIPPDLFDYLEVEKERADKERQDVLIDFNGIKLHLKSHGGNGYRFIASGGPGGAHWFFKKPNARDKWGIRVSFGSHFMAFHGLAAARIHLDYVCERLGIRFGDKDVSISRVDFCVDILAPEFTLIPEHFAMHSSTGRRDFIEETNKAVHGKSGRTSSVTIGGPRNRQVIIYDKRAEIIHSNKVHWWGIWNHTLQAKGLPPLAPENPDTSRVWRVEFRAGKDLLKDRWNIRTWAQLYERFGDLCRETGEVVRYTIPSPSDPNRARWPNHLLWETVCAEINGDLCEMRSGCDPNPMKEVHKEAHISILTKNIIGCTLTLAVLKGQTFESLPEFFRTTATDMSLDVTQSPQKTHKQLQAAKDRYVFIHPPQNAFR